MSEEYHTTSVSPGPSGSEPRDGSASLRRQIRAVKEGVRIERVASEYGEFKLLGSNRLLGRCVSPGHEDKTPSLTIFPDTQTFKCFGIGCGARGDALDLVMLAEGCELWVAMVGLSVRYGITLPGRPATWYAKQERQRPVRDAIYEAKVYAARRRLYRRFFEPVILASVDEEDRKHDAQLFWEATDPLARHLIDNMMGGDRGR